MFHALKNVNLAKNRTLELVPLSVKRVLLPVQPGVDGSDYINASYLQVITVLNSVQKLCGTGFSQFPLLCVILGPTSL